MYFFYGFEKRAKKEEESKALPIGLATGAVTGGAAAGETYRRIRKAENRVQSAKYMTKEEINKMLRPGDVVLTSSGQKIKGNDVNFTWAKNTDVSKPIAGASGSPYYHSQYVGYTKGKKGSKVIGAMGAGEKSQYEGRSKHAPGRTSYVVLRPKDKAQAERAARRAPSLARTSYGNNKQLAEWAARNILGIRGKKDTSNKKSSKCAPGGKSCHVLTSSAHREVLPKHSSPMTMINSKDFDVVGRTGTPRKELTTWARRGLPTARGLIGAAVGMGLGYGTTKAVEKVVG